MGWFVDPVILLLDGFTLVSDAGHELHTGRGKLWKSFDTVNLSTFLMISCHVGDFPGIVVEWVVGCKYSGCLWRDCMCGVFCVTTLSPPPWVSGSRLSDLQWICFPMLVKLGSMQDSLKVSSNLFWLISWCEPPWSYLLWTTGNTGDSTALHKNFSIHNGLVRKNFMPLWFIVVMRKHE